jgi:hypothetical protein
LTIRISHAAPHSGFLPGVAGTANKKETLIKQKEIWITQRERLKNHIYLSASLLVVALVFLKTRTHYPSFMLKQDETALAAHHAVCTENLLRVDETRESPKLTRW